MSPFCEGLVSCGLWEFHDQEEQVPKVVNSSIGFSAILSCELFEVVDKVLEETIACDLIVRATLHPVPPRLSTTEGDLQEWPNPKAY